MLVNHDDLLDDESSQGFEINDSTRQRLIGYVKAEISSQAHYCNMDHDVRVDAVSRKADIIEFDGFNFTFRNLALLIKMIGKVGRLM